MTHGVFSLLVDIEQASHRRTGDLVVGVGGVETLLTQAPDAVDIGLARYARWRDITQWLQQNCLAQRRILGIGDVQGINYCLFNFSPGIALTALDQGRQIEFCGVGLGLVDVNLEDRGAFLDTR